MSWVTAVTSVAAARQASAIGKYNQQIQNRNAQVAEQEAQAIEKQNEFTLARFEQQFAQLQGQTKTAILKSGATLEGSGLNVLRYNAEQAEIEKILQDNIIRYNASIGKAKAYERANFATISGQVAKQQSRLAQIGTLTQTGTNLLTMSNFGNSTPYQTSNTVGPGGRFGRI